jgi:hypothetical protein
MNFRRTAAVAICGSLFFAIFDFLVVSRFDDRERFWYSAIARIGLLAMTAIAAAGTAHQFAGWRQHFGRAWTLFALEYGLLALSEISRRFFPEIVSTKAVLVTVANIAGVGAYWLMARSLRAAGLEYFGSRAKKIGVVLFAVALAAALCLRPFMDGIAEARAGQLHIDSLVSIGCDMLTFILVAPLLLTAYSLRGGRLAWTFACLTAGTFGWMLNQASQDLFSSTDAIRAGRMTGFAMACLFVAAAAWTHRMPKRGGAASRG